MRAFIAIVLIAAVRADVDGYRYGAGLSGGSFGAGSLSDGLISGGTLGDGSFGVDYLDGSLDGSSLSGISLGSGFLGGSLGNGLLSNSYSSGSYGGGPLQVSSLSSGISLGSGSLGGGSHGGGSLDGVSVASGSIGTSSSNYAAPVRVTSELSKDFYTFSAPEADFEDSRAINDISASLKRNLRVIFIRAPENRAVENAALSIARQYADQQTAIYVLTRQSDVAGLAQRLQNINSVTISRPEVHFFKYRTPEDAANAQRAITLEYERLGGASQSHNGGIAPVLDFASRAVSSSGSLGGPIAGGSLGSSVDGNSVGGSTSGGSLGGSISVGSLGGNSLNSSSLGGGSISSGSLSTLEAPASDYIPPVSREISTPSTSYLPAKAK